MAKGLSLHVGLNIIDSKHYDGWDGKLKSCERDAKDMNLIATTQKFESTILLGKKATRENVINNIRGAAGQLDPGDIFFVSYSGHGGQLPDLNGDEPDGLDETWCLYDGELIDDELYELWSLFKNDVRILITSDSCHSGSIVKGRINFTTNTEQVQATPKFLDMGTAMATYLHNKEFYDILMSKQKKTSDLVIEASIIQISGCQDNQLSYDGNTNGFFTEALKCVWNGGKFKGNYRTFHRKIQNMLPSIQSPNFLTLGKENKEFEQQKPFTI